MKLSTTIILSIIGFVGAIVFDYLIDPEVNAEGFFLLGVLGICNFILFSIMFTKNPIEFTKNKKV